MILDILGWTVDECLDYLKMFANKAFPPRSCILRFMSKVPLLSTFTRLTLFFFTLLTDSKYSANGLESLLMDTYGLHRGITDCSFASHIGSHVGVTLTRARDGAGFIATNYNQAGCRPEILGTFAVQSSMGLCWKTLIHHRRLLTSAFRMWATSSEVVGSVSFHCNLPHLTIAQY